MSEQLNEDQDLETPVVDETTENELEDAELPEDKKLETILAQKKHWREKAVDPKTGKTYKTLLEEQLKKVEPQKPVKEVQPSQNYVARDEFEEGILRTSKGYGDEDVEVLKTLSKGKGISLFQAEQDPMFKLHLEHKAEEEKKAKAQLPASKGSDSTGAKKAPETRDEHQEFWKEKSGR